MHVSRSSALGALAIAMALGGARAEAQISYGPPYRITGGFENPFGVAIDETQGNLIVSDTRNRQLRWTTLSSLTATPVFQTFGFVADATQATALVDPQGVAADDAGHVYVVDARRNVVKLYTWSAATSNYVLDPGFAAGATTTVGGTAIRSPRDVAVGPDGKVYLLDSGNHRVLRADGAAAATWTVFLNDPSLSNPYGIDVGPDGRVYIADTDHDRVVRYNSAGGSPVVFGHTGTGGGELRAPRDVAADVDGRMYIADSHNHRIEILDVNGQHVRSIGRAPTLGGIQKIAVDSSRRLFLADADFDVVLAFLGPDAAVPFDAWARDYTADNGVEPSDPAFTLGSPDLIVRHNADVNAATAQTNGLESIAFQSPRFGEENYVYVAVRNRGTQLLTDAVAKLYWADPSTPLAFPGDWRDDGLVQGTMGEVLGNTLLVPPVPPGESRVIGPIRWRPPAPETSGLGSGTFVLAVRVVQPFDVPGNGAGLNAVRASNNVAIRTVHVLRGPFSTGDQNTLVVRAGYSDDTSPVDSATMDSRITGLAAWVHEVSWGVATIKPLYRGQVNLPHPRSYYAAPSRTRLIEMTQDALTILLGTEPELLDGALPTPNDDIGRVILVTNDTTTDIDWATTGAWPYAAPGGGDMYLTASVQGIGNAATAFEHGLGHQLGMLDLFAYPNVVFPRPFAEGWDNMARPFSGVHPTLWSKELATWVSAHGAPIVFIPRPPRGSSFTTPSPIHLFNQATAEAGQTIGIALGLTSGIGSLSDETAFYYLESRSPGTGGADAAVPGDGALLYYVNTGIPQGQGPILVRDHVPATAALTDAAIPNGSSESPTGTGITVNVAPGTAGAARDITLTYTPSPTGYDVWIRTGNPVWTSPDIWVDNQSDGYDVENGHTPTDHGDRAIGGEQNRLYARVHNAGEADAYDVEVAFFISEPYHTIGGEEDFTLLQSIIIPHLPPGEMPVYVTWTPTVHNPHTCVKVVLRRLLDDVNTANNWAQQNLEVVWSTNHSPFTPVTTTYQVTNSDSVASKLMYFRADQVPAGWTRQIVPARAYLAPRQQITVTLTLTPPPTAPNCTTHDVQVTAWTPQGHTLTRLGGATYNVNLARQAGLDMKVDTLTCTDVNYRLAYAKQQAQRAEAERNGWVPHLGAAGRTGLVGIARVRDADGKRAAGAERVPARPIVTRVDPSKTVDCGGDKQCLIVRTRGCTDPVQVKQQVVVRYRDARGEPEYRVTQTDAQGCFEDFQVLNGGGEWTVTAAIDANNCLAPIEVTQVLPLPTPPDSMNDGPSLTRPTVVTPVYVRAKGALTMRGKGAAPCATCQTVHTTHRVELALRDALTGAAFGTLVSDSLVSALTPVALVKTSVGVHVGAATVKLADGTVVVGVMRGTTNGTSHPRTAGSAGALVKAFDGEFIGRAADGKRRGCKLVLHYALTPTGDPASGNAQLVGLVDGVWECSCEKNFTSGIPALDPLPNGCVVPFVAAGDGKWRQDVLKGLVCGGKKIVGEITSAAGGMAGVGGISSPDLTSGTFRLDTLTHIHSASETTPALHGGSFSYVSAAGDRIEGRVLSGLTNMNPHRASPAPAAARHLEGILRGSVISGALKGCELRGVYSASYAGATMAGSPGTWAISGAIVCPCRRADGGTVIPGGADSARGVPGWVRDSIRRQLVRDSLEHAKVRDAALIARFGPPSRLTAAERRIADRNRDGTVTPLEVADFVMVRDMFRAEDRNRDGGIDLAEFTASAVERLSATMRLAVARYTAGDTARANLPPLERRILAGADVNNDGNVSDQELAALATKGAREQFAMLDRNHDKRLTLDEWAGGPGGAKPTH